MIDNYTARFVKRGSGYVGQIVEWPAVVTHGPSLDDCRSLLHSTLNKMVHAYRCDGRDIPQSANDIYTQAGLELK